MNRWTQAGTLFVGIVPTDPSEITLGNLLELNLKHSLCHTFIIFKEVWRRDERQTAEIFRVWMLSFEINQPGDWGWDAAHFFQYFKLDSTTTHWRQSRKSDGKIILVSLVIKSFNISSQLSVTFISFYLPIASTLIGLTKDDTCEFNTWWVIYWKPVSPKGVLF